MSSDDVNPIADVAPSNAIATDPADGWVPSPLNAGFLSLIGPYYVRPCANGGYEMGFVAGPQHLNGGGSVHGGCLLTLADTALFMFSRPLLKDTWVVTMQLELQFIAPGRAGDFIYATGEVTQATMSVIFARGELRSGDRLLMSFSGILKKKKTAVTPA